MSTSCLDHFENDILFLGDVRKLRSLEANLENFQKISKTHILRTSSGLKSLCEAYIIETTKKWPILETALHKVFKTGFTSIVNPLGVPQEFKENVGEIR